MTKPMTNQPYFPSKKGLFSLSYKLNRVPPLFIIEISHRAVH